jgi:hypothetical protein
MLLAILFLIDSTCFRHHYVYHKEFATLLLDYHIGCIVLGLLCVGGWVWFGLGSVRVAGCLLMFSGPSIIVVVEE